MTETTSSPLWRSLFYFNIYRLVLAVVLMVLAINQVGDIGALNRYPTIFLATAIGITLLSILYFFTINTARPPFPIQSHTQTSLDLVAITLLIHTSDGFSSGFGFLMIVTVAAISLLDTRRAAVSYAALGTLLALGEQSFSYLNGFTDAKDFRGPGFLGVGLFTTALLVTKLADRIQQTEALASRRGVDLANMDALNRQIVDLIPTGALAADKNNRILVCNTRARILLHLMVNPEGRRLDEIAPALGTWLENTRIQASAEPAEFQLHGNIMQPSREAFGNGDLVFLEDLSGERALAQQLKLTALGRLAAAIAHEIRNPLSAIYQSAQLLGESESLEPADTKIVSIIGKQSERIERIIESILQISRGDSGEAEPIILPLWLEGFAHRFCAEKNLDDNTIVVAGTPMTVYMDTGHLVQILTNLCENAIAHSEKAGTALIRLEHGRDPETGKCFLEIIDHGKGIDKFNQQKLFEPFFTTRNTGTGLGLYISRELCEANQARLSYQPGRKETVFRITFPLRQEN